MDLRRPRLLLFLGLIVLVVLLAWGIADRRAVPIVADPAVSESPGLTRISPPEGASRAALADPEVQQILVDLCPEADLRQMEDPLSPEAIEDWSAVHERMIGRVTQALSVSSAAEHLHVAALLEGDRAKRIELLERALAVSPGDPHLLWDAVRICAREMDAADCPLREWERRMLRADAQNSEAWIQVASNRYRAGETEAALDALLRAAASAETRLYWTETVEKMERGMVAAGSGLTFPERAITAIGLSAAQLPAFQAQIAMCRELSAADSEWAYACLAYGELAERQGRTYLGQAMSRAMQTVALKGLDDREKLAVVEERERAARQEMQESAQGVGALANELLDDPAVWHAYLANIRQHGEAGAKERLIAETRRRLSEEPELLAELVCPP